MNEVKLFVQWVLHKANPYVLFLQTMNSIGFDLHKHTIYVLNGPFWTIECFQEEEGVVITISHYLPNFVTQTNSIDLDN